MRDDIFALLLMLGGLGCIVAWGVCQAVAAIGAYRLQRATDAMKLHIIKGGHLPDGVSLALARSYLHVQWLGIIGNILLHAGSA